MNKKIFAGFLSVVLICAVAFLPLSAVAIAGDGEAVPNDLSLTVEDIFKMMGDTVYSCGNMTLSAVTDGGAPSGIKIKDPPQSTTMPLASFEFSGENGVYRLSRDNRPQTEYADFDYDFTTVTFNVSDGTVVSVEILGSGMSVAMPDGGFYCYDYDGVYMIPGGTEEHPWQIGDGVTAYVEAYPEYGGMMLYVKGYGEMTDFADLSQRPWDGISSEIKGCIIDEEITHIGDNAFKNLGGDESFDLYLFRMEASLTTIGDGAFEGLSLDGGAIAFSDNVYHIGAHAFADTGNYTIAFYGVPSEIADDAFAGVTAEVYVVYGEWNEETKLSYGGNLSYKTMYRLEYEHDYGTEEISGNGYAYYNEGESVYIIAEPMSEDYHFVRWEVVEGNFEISDPTNPELTADINDNVKVRAIFESNSGENDEPTDDPTRPDVTVPTQVIIIIIVSIIVVAAVTVIAVIYITHK